MMMAGEGQFASIVRTLSQDDFDAFAKLSGDNNPIHVDVDFSAQTSFGRTVSHGMLLYSILRGLTEKLVPGARQLSQELMFPAPAYADVPIRFEARVVSSDGDLRHLEMTASNVADQTIVCDASGVFQLGQGDG